ncbi:nucleoside-diphosphate-sugar epimerase [Kineococcus xinjiangensis]|uniref:Nucleoside-diphosphate-sugar epimerase n=1 Tax=Kineococcus xinjiangensis TaxID=512762 RepID=A0A2S6ITM7_9ACTN|nr:NAD(P)-dependent oxidoreductase [Kineococcus xinjiangensis]PPK97406.1 nucleoside-diphosphate-sugar epimerase [Kineococcus xinjiangensis]
MSIEPEQSGGAAPVAAPRPVVDGLPGPVRTVCVTGASGRVGGAVVADLLANGYRVRATDERDPGRDLGAPFLRADLTDFGQAVELLDGVDAVVHLANIPAPGLLPDSVTFADNTTMNYNVFTASARAGLERVVWASSETTLGLPFENPPDYVPVDEDHYPRPESAYALSKVASEIVAEQVSRWSGIPFVALRFSNVLTPEDYQHFPEVWRRPTLRRWNLWGYVDSRDAAAACRLGLEAPLDGAQSFIIAAADTVLDRPSLDALREEFPGVEVIEDVPGHQTLLSIDRARELLGYEPKHSWRDHVEPALRRS